MPDHVTTVLLVLPGYLRLAAVVVLFVVALIAVCWAAVQRPGTPTRYGYADASTRSPP